MGFALCPPGYEHCARTGLNHPPKHMNIGVSTWLWTSPFSTETTDLLAKIRGMGFDFVEIAAENTDIIDGKVIARVLQDLQLGVVVCGAWGSQRDLTSDDPRLRQNSFDYIERCFDLCQQLGAKFLAGPMYSAVGKARLVPPAQRQLEWQRAVENLRRVAESAASRGLQIALEPLNRFESDLVNTAEDVMKLTNEIGHPAARVMLDSFHMTIEERDLKTAIETVGSRLIHVQVSENYRGAPGSGQTRWDDFREGLHSVGYKGRIAVESFTTENKELAGAVCFWKPKAESQDQFARDSLAFLRKTF
jgi:D-psicose/D-tagatose/L-ribulose 3-epimerase